jgi:hypothetical protein
MKRIAALFFVVTAFTVLASVGCQTRDAKKLALAVAPQSNPCGLTNYEGAILPNMFCQTILGTTYGKAAAFRNCYEGKHQAVYSFTVIQTPDKEKSYPNVSIPIGAYGQYYSGHIHIRLYNTDSGYDPSPMAVANAPAPSNKYVSFELRKGCDDSTILACESTYNGGDFCLPGAMEDFSGDYQEDMAVGTYYLALSSYDYSLSDAGDSEMNYSLEIYDYYGSECGYYYDKKGSAESACLHSK